MRLPKRMTCSRCDYLFDRTDERAFIHREAPERSMCPACALMSLRSREAWAVWNSCNGPFEVAMTFPEAQALLSERYADVGAVVVPVRIAAEPDDEHRFRWSEIRAGRMTADEANAAQQAILDERRNHAAAVSAG